MAIISQKEGELNAAWTILATTEAKALADIVVAREAAEAKEAIATTRAEAEKAPEDEFGLVSSMGILT